MTLVLGQCEFLRKGKYSFSRLGSWWALDYLDV